MTYYQPEPVTQNLLLITVMSSILIQLITTCFI